VDDLYRDLFARFSERLAMRSKDGVVRLRDDVASPDVFFLLIEARFAACRRFWNQAVTALRSLSASSAQGVVARIQ
jgi:hypothetical protein